MEETFTPHSDNCTSDQSAPAAFEILSDGSEHDFFERDLKRMLEKQLVQPSQESINRILCFSKSL